MRGWRSHARVEPGAVLLVGALAVVTVLASRDIGSEGAVSLHGDMPRHMMNGVFVLDVLRSGVLFPIDNAADYAREYFVRYPALSLGHHPPLLAALLVPFYAVAGVSVLSARFAMVLSMLVATGALYSLTRRLYGSLVAGWTALLFAGHPFLVPFGQSVMSEAPMLALILLATDALLRFRLSMRTRDYAVFVILAAAALYAKQLASFMFPTFAMTLLLGAPWLRGRLLRPDIVLLTLGGALLCLPIVVMTAVLSPHNVAVVAETTTAEMGEIADMATETVLPAMFDAQLSWPLALAMAGGVLVSVIKRDRRMLFVLFWTLMVIGCVALFIGPYEAPRYAILAVPAYCLCAATLLTTSRRSWRVAATLVLALAALRGVTAAAAIRPVGAGGYEAAAKYVLSRTDSPTVLYSASVDTGYFVFFVRKHDPGASQVVLRADKMLTTSMMGELDVEHRIDEPDEIYPLLQQYGTRLIVIEDHESGSEPLDWLRDELHGDHFVPLRRFPIETRDQRLRGVDIVVYEYLDATPPAADAEIDVGLPLIGRDIRLDLDDLLGGR